MSICKGTTWECERCHKWDTSEPWNCPVCKKETCEYCFSAYGVCNECAKGKTPDECKVMAEANGWDWSEDNETVPVTTRADTRPDKQKGK